MPFSSFRIFWSALIFSTLLGGFSLAAQAPTGRRVVAVVPMIGSGTWEDPRRPMFTEAQPLGGKAGTREAGALDYQYVLSDDGKSAIVEFRVERHSEAAASKFSEITGSRLSTVATFEADKQKKEDVERELKKVKKDFSLEVFLGLRKNGGVK